MLAAGLSRNKLASLRDLSAKVLDGTVEESSASRRSDEEIIASLVTVRGIGRWTAEMYLMFELRRPDVWPVDDLGVRQGYGLAWVSTRRRWPGSWLRSATGSAVPLDRRPLLLGGRRPLPGRHRPEPALAGYPAGCRELPCIMALTASSQAHH